MAKNRKPPVAGHNTAPVQQQTGGTLAPWPSTDRWPTIIGSSLTLQYISSVFRTAQTGYRREYVDVLDELVERDPHAFAVLSQRILAVSGGKLSVVPAHCDESDEELAKEIALDVEQALHGMSNRRQAIANLLRGIFYGVSAAEINWGVLDGKWSPVSLSWIHSRRLAYPDMSDWKVRIWDLGMTWGWGNSSVSKDPTSMGFGLAPSDFPGKFIIHTPQVRGEYPTRDGLGREMAYWMAIKLMAARGFAAFVERFGKPWPIGYYSTTKEGKDKPRAADDDDKKILEQTMLNIGAGNLSGAALPNSVWAELSGPTSGSGSALPSELPQAALIRVCDSQIAKAVLGQDDTTGAGQNGSRASTETRKDGTIELYRYDSACICDTLKRDLVWWYVHLNYPGQEHLCPTPHIDVEPPPDRKIESDIIVNAVTAGMPLDADDAAIKLGLKLIPSDDETPRRLFLNKGCDNPSFFDVEPVISPEAQQVADTAEQSAANQDTTDTVPATKQAKPGKKPKAAKTPKVKV